MAEVFHFTKNLRKIVAPRLKDLGFTQVGSRFLRSRGTVTDEIDFQRSQWNDSASGEPLKFFLNLKCGTGNEPWRLTDVRLLNPDRRPFPDWWLQLTPEERKERRKTLSAQELEPVETAVTSSEWLYASEEALCSLLNTVVAEILEKGIPYLEAVSELLDHPDRESLISRLKAEFRITAY
jgi:hypothetical protein